MSGNLSTISLDYVHTKMTSALQKQVMNPPKKKTNNNKQTTPPLSTLFSAFDLNYTIELHFCTWLCFVCNIQTWLEHDLVTCSN